MIEVGIFNWRYLFRLAIGVAFIWAALAKIGDLNTFAGQVHNFRILPGSIENLFAMTLPWIEVVAGLFLILNIAPRAATALMTLLLLMFFVAVSQALVRNLDIDCGCFGTGDAGSTAIKTLIRDVVFLVAAFLGWPRKGETRILGVRDELNQGI